MIPLLVEIRENAKKNPKRIVLPESTDERTLKAADFVIQEKIAHITLIGNKDNILSLANTLNLNNIKNANIVNPDNYPEKEKYANILYNLRKDKGLTIDEANNLVKNPLYLATLMVKNGDVDGEVAGAINTTRDVLKPAYQIIKTLPGISVVSGAFIMILQDKQLGENGIMVFADCASIPDPDEKQLAEIAICSDITAKNVAQIKEPRIAMLSFSTKGSAKHPLVDKVVNATKIAKQLNPNINVDGELQLDAAIIPEVGKSKAPQSNIAGKANVLVFPSLEAGNIGYKLVQRIAKAETIGPIMQGLAAPINDLSRGCSVEDIINQIAITVNQARHN